MKRLLYYSHFLQINNSFSSNILGCFFLTCLCFKTWLNSLFLIIYLFIYSICFTAFFLSCNFHTLVTVSNLFCTFPCVFVFWSTKFNVSVLWFQKAAIIIYFSYTSFYFRFLDLKTAFFSNRLFLYFVNFFQLLAQLS